MYTSFIVKVKCLLHIIDNTQDFKFQMFFSCSVSELCAVLYAMDYIVANSMCPPASQDWTNEREALHINLLAPGAGWFFFFYARRGSALLCYTVAFGLS